MLNVGDEVKFKDPIISEGEDRATFILIELNGDRCFIELHTFDGVEKVGLERAQRVVMTDWLVKA